MGRRIVVRSVCNPGVHCSDSSSLCRRTNQSHSDQLAQVCRYHCDGYDAVSLPKVPPGECVV